MSPLPFFGFLLLGILAQGRTSHQAFKPSARVAIYWDRGVWEIEAKKALPALLESMRISFRFVSSDEIKKGILKKGGRKGFDLLIVPGGWAPDYIEQLGGWDGKGRGDDEIRGFLKRGGAYLGFCAGAFAAVRTTRWLGVDHAYPWRLVDACAEGPLAWNPLRKGKLGAVHGTVVLNMQAREWKGRRLPKTIHPLLFGGPRFLSPKRRKGGKKFRILARHGEDHSPAIILSKSRGNGGGRILLCSFHPAVLTDDKGKMDRSKVTMAKYGAGKDPDGFLPDWRLAEALVEIALGEKAFKPRVKPASRKGKK
jgi:glutamine amidotransferase-like uncharacterized protein